MLTADTEAQNATIRWWINPAQMTALYKRAAWRAPARRKQGVHAAVQAA